MTDKFRIDSHKLMYHVARVSDWLRGDTVYPIYMEVSPAGACNHRCTFCGLDFMGYQPRFLETGRFKDTLTELGRLGLKSIMYAGEGEPFLHKDMVELILHTREAGIDVALTTNGVLMKSAIAERILGSVQWIKVSCNAGTPETYAEIHRTKAGDFEKVLDNLSRAVQLKRESGSACTLGMQILLLPENEHEIEMLAQTVRDIGLSYLVVKPYSQHPQSNTDHYSNITYSRYEPLAETIAEYTTPEFKVIFRLNSMQQWDEQQKSYQCCQSLPFWSYIDAGGTVWGCSVYLEDERFKYGNIYEQSFQEIWEGEQRRKSLLWVEKELDASVCRVNCRMDAINRYLWDLKHPIEHVNFI